MELHNLVFTVKTNGSPSAIADIVREVGGALAVTDVNPPGMAMPLIKQLSVTLDGERYWHDA